MTCVFVVVSHVVRHAKLAEELWKFMLSWRGPSLFAGDMLSGSSSALLIVIFL
jgi:hypothetical protein